MSSYHPLIWFQHPQLHRSSRPTRFPGIESLEELTPGNPIERDMIYGESFAHDIADIENSGFAAISLGNTGNQKLLVTYDGQPENEVPSKNAELNCTI